MRHKKIASAVNLHPCIFIWPWEENRTKGEPKHKIRTIKKGETSCFERSAKTFELLRQFLQICLEKIWCYNSLANLQTGTKLGVNSVFCRNYYVRYLNGLFKLFKTLPKT